jgi:DNA polymerase-3 subunit epsilon
VDLDGNPIGYWSSLINPKRSVGATHIHGIKDSDVADSPTIQDLADELFVRIRGQVIVAHNASFDLAFLRIELGRTGWQLPDTPVVCTMRESKSFIPGLARQRLSDCAEALGIRHDVQHRALGDAATTSALFHFYLNGPTNRTRAVELRRLPALASKSQWPTSKSAPIDPVLPPSRPFRQTKPAEIETLRKVSALSPEDLFSESPSIAELSYSALLLGALEDGRISDTELSALSDCATTLGLKDEGVRAIHTALVFALAREAWSDGTVSRAEQREVTETCLRLGLEESVAKACFSEVENIRMARLATETKALPLEWNLGDPLRVGDRVVITGCYEVGRTELEDRSRKSGIRITGSVSGKTKLLVSDQTINGNKDADAHRLGIRIVGPEEFHLLLEYVQPSLGAKTVVPQDRNRNLSQISIPAQSLETENLMCVSCGSTFIRSVSRGRKPHQCESCL